MRSEELLLVGVAQIRKFTTRPEDSLLVGGLNFHNSPEESWFISQFKATNLVKYLLFKNQKGHHEKRRILLVGQGLNIHYETRRISLGGGGLESEHSPGDQTNFSWSPSSQTIHHVTRRISLGGSGLDQRGDQKNFSWWGWPLLRQFTTRPEEFLLVGVGLNHNIHQETGRISLGGGSLNQKAHHETERISLGGWAQIR